MNQSTQTQLKHSLEVLGVEPTQSWDDIEKQYRQLAQRWHPDRKAGHDRDVAKGKFVEINAAYTCIRSHYRNTGSVQYHIPIKQTGPLLGTKKQTVVKPALYKNKFVIAGITTMMIVVLFGALLLSLDSRLAENNRGRAITENTAPAMKSNLPPIEPTNLQGDLSRQSSTDSEL